MMLLAHYIFDPTTIIISFAVGMLTGIVITQWVRSTRNTRPLKNSEALTSRTSVVQTPGNGTSH